jgi:hypothetical protein
MGKLSAVRAVGANISRPIKIGIGEAASAAPIQASRSVPPLTTMSNEKISKSTQTTIAGITNNDFNFRFLINGISRERAPNSI